MGLFINHSFVKYLNIVEVVEEPPPPTPFTEPHVISEGGTRSCDTKRSGKGNTRNTVELRRFGTSILSYQYRRSSVNEQEENKDSYWPAHRSLFQQISLYHRSCGRPPFSRVCYEEEREKVMRETAETLWNLDCLTSPFLATITEDLL